MGTKSPLHAQHLALGGRMVEFGGWDMPIQYKGVIAEHKSVRESAGLFDVSHLGKLVVPISGLDALDRALPGKVAKLGEWRAAYNLVLNDEAGIVDDIFVYRHPDYFLVVPNASNTLEVLEHLHRAGVAAEDARFKWGIIALSGPEAKSIIERLIPEVAALKLHRFSQAQLDRRDLMVARTGYTGEPTFELFCDWGEAPDVWSSVLGAGGDQTSPAGLGSRDTLRLEMGYPLHGHDISPRTDPFAAGLGWVIDWDKEFEHRPLLEKLRATSPERKLVGLVGQGREIPREGYQVLEKGEPVGVVTSGNFSVVLGTGIALAYVRTDLASPGTMLEVAVREKILAVVVKEPPFIGD